MPKFKNLIGQKFSRWTVIARGKMTPSGLRWACRCDCGIERQVIGDSLKRGTSKSCGCLVASISTTHNMTNTPTYYSWVSMKTRCHNPKSPDFKRYGGRGIKVCDRWVSFANFFADMGERPIGTTLDRVDNNGNYEPGNCRWATASQQSRNRGGTPKGTVKGITKPIADMAEDHGLRRKMVSNRLLAGWSLEKALSTPHRFKMARCKRGHEYTPENLAISKAGTKVCRECSRLKTAAYRTRKRKFECSVS